MLQDTAPITGIIDVEVLFMVASSWLLKFDFKLDLQLKILPKYSKQLKTLGNANDLNTLFMVPEIAVSNTGECKYFLNCDR